MLEDLHSSLTMYSGQSFTSCGRKSVAGTSFALGTLEHELALLAPMGGGWPLDRNSLTLGSKTKWPIPLCRQHLHYVHRAGQGAIRGHKHQAIGLTKGGHNSMLTTTVDERGHVVALLLFPGQCAETTAAKQLRHFWPKPWFSSGTRASTPMNSDSLSRTTAA
jgi:hypothetical protein